MPRFTHEPQLEDYYQHGTYNYQQYKYDLECYHSPDGVPNSDLFDLDGHPRDSEEETVSYEPEKPTHPKITPELQAKIDKARAEIKERKKDCQWIAICAATKALLEGDHKIAARNLIQTYLKAHQR